MNKVIYNKFDKSRISLLPRVTFPGRIVVILNETEAEKAVDYLLSRDIIGIDTETRPVFKKGHRRKVALLQACDHDVCFLFRLNYIGIPDCIKRFLEDTTVPKVGLSLSDDMLMLHQRANFKPGYFIDLQDYVKSLGIEDMSLQKLYANVFHERIAKREQLSNWENEVLNDKQKLYASTDAWTCIKLYERLHEMKETGDYKLVVVPTPEPAIPVEAAHKSE
jgi:3'-5' exonuclease domain protein